MMKISVIALSAIIVSFAFVSCHKDTDQPASTNDITGTWKFISIKAKTTNTQEVSDGPDVLKTITSSEYTTEKNSGTLTFDGSKMSTNNLSYSINTISKSSIYENGTLTDTFSLPVQFTAPASSGSATYKKIGADSIYVESGSVLNSGVTPNTQGGGAKLKLENDKLYLIQSGVQSTTETDQGATATSTLQGTFTITLQRQ